MDNKFITIEGVDGAGKSTIISSIKNYLENKDHEVVLTREPGGTNLGERLRDLLLNHKMDLVAETMLMFTARAQHIQEVIKPALAAGKFVVCDRFTDSTFAYQSYAKGLDLSIVKDLQNIVQQIEVGGTKQILKPGITFILDVPLNISKERLAKTKKIPDKFESEKDDFFEKVINGYKSIARQDPNRCKLINAAGTPEETIDQVLFNLEQFYKKVNGTTPPKRKM